MDSLMTDSDARLIHALQLAPRATWSEFSRVLAQSPVVLARRYERLRAAGVVKVIGHPSGFNISRNLAFVEIDCEPGSLAAVTETLVELPMAMTVDVTSSGTCLIATLIAPDDESLATVLLDTLPSLPGIREVQTHIATSTLKTGDNWNLRALDTEEVALLPAPRLPRARAARTLDPQFRSELMARLGEDARKPAAALARELGVSEQKVHDAITRLIHTKEFLLRTDVTSAWSEWPVHVWYFADIPPRQLSTVATALSAHPEIRYVGTSAGPANLAFDVWLRSLGVMHVFEERITSLAQAGIKLRRQVILRTPKRVGHVLNYAGRFTDRYIALSGL